MINMEGGCDDRILECRKGNLNILRQELGHLKGCQTNLLLFSSAAAGIFLSLLQNPTILPSSIIFLLPLVFLLPLWIIFYDKARTIARIVGFLRVQEKLYDCQNSLATISWESAMKLYWKKRDVWNNRFFDEYFIVNTVVKSPWKSVYWMTVFFTFLAFSLACITLSVVYLEVSWIEKFFFVFFPVAITYFSKNPILELSRIGKNSADVDIKNVIIDLELDKKVQDRPPNPNFKRDNKRECSIREGEHTDIVNFFRKAVRFAGVYLISFTISWLLSVCCFVDPSMHYFASLDIIPVIVYCVFTTTFVFSVSIAYWMFANLVNGRYSYDVFEKRWQIILDVLIIDEWKRITSSEEIRQLLEKMDDVIHVEWEEICKKHGVKKVEISQKIQ